MELKTSYKNTTLSPIYAGTSSVASISSDGSILATPILDEINIVKFIDNNSYLLDNVSNDDEQEITALQLSPDGKYLCYASTNQLLKIYNIVEKKFVKSLKISSPSYVMSIDQTSTLLAVGGTDGSVTVIDIENSYITHSFKGHGATISAVKFYSDASTQNNEGWLLFSGDTAGMIKVCDMVKRRCLYTFQEHTSAIRGLDIRLSPSHVENDEPLLQLLSGGRDDIVNLWEFNLRRKSKLIKTIPVYQQVEACGFLNGNYEDLIYTGGSDAIFQILSISSNKILKKTLKPIEELFIIGVLPILDNSKFYLVLSDQTLLLVDVEENMAEDENPSEYVDHTIIKIENSIAGNHGTIADMRVVDPTLSKLALATNSPTLRIIPISEANEEADSKDALSRIPIDVDMYEGHTDLLNSLDSTEDSLWIATASKDNSCILWRYNAVLEKYQIYAKFLGHASSVTAVGLPNVLTKNYPDYVITASNDSTIKKWKVPKPTKNLDNNDSFKPHEVKLSEYTRRAHDKDINALSISPNDSIFATASYDKTCKIWDLESGDLKATLVNHKRGLWDVSFCQYDKFIVTASGDKTIKMWSLDTFTVVKTFEGHSNAVQRCQFINKQKQLVSCGADGLIKIWDCSSGECIKTLDGHSNRIWALSVINDGDVIISADADGVFQFWRDCTGENREKDLEKERLKVEQEQSLQNYLANEDWTNAFLLAMTLDHPLRLFNVLRKSLGGKEGSTSSDDDTKKDADGKPILFNKELDNVIANLSNDQVLLLMKRCRDWNTNARTHLVAQRCIRCILLHYNISDLSEIPGMIQIVDSIIPYTQRHYAKVDGLLEESYILDYSLIQMDKIF
ncbi:hypothetical protein TBLA_0I02570 [Henningerozyma blattae CBS 6284]|uniref:U3 small nucleolar RNA-associated protein 13 C-terminal domain-containing protein n=1 Tax=Henningerozyma blattae (strain ATCC 34711 / CBS 6284 / DSM 70876 / NBRC 10599 / NRRL Y-10934 / UCD 77-7) TaxID=1071380 RepID=I2H961_HENB6|nr:hypothetical protein TBLA_0I02570 [Tetrapisispora blattae CBS 6284]CCH62913.1 hypothetical protein TBLA_0I02570 [Tetrapisispora blattae CBS 6284]